VHSVINSIDLASFHMLPLIDDERQRDMLKESFEDESVGQTEELIAEVAELLKSGKGIPATKFVQYQTRYLEQKEKMEEYKKLLGDALARSNHALDIAGQQISALLDAAGE